MGPGVGVGRGCEVRIGGAGQPSRSKQKASILYFLTRTVWTKPYLLILAAGNRPECLHSSAQVPFGLVMLPIYLGLCCDTFTPAARLLHRPQALGASCLLHLPAHVSADTLLVPVEPSQLPAAQEHQMHALSGQLKPQTHNEFATHLRAARKLLLYKMD